MGDEARIWRVVEPMLATLSSEERARLFAVMLARFCVACGRDLEATACRCLRCADTTRAP
jgi:hypothetical protein